MKNTLKNLITYEAECFNRLNLCILSPLNIDSEVERAANNCESAIEDCLAFRIQNYDEFKSKYDFVFNLIERNYEDHAELSRMRSAIFTDIEALKRNS